MVEQMYRPRDYLVRLVYDGADVIKNARKKSTIENKRIKKQQKTRYEEKKTQDQKIRKTEEKNSRKRIFEKVDWSGIRSWRRGEILPTCRSLFGTGYRPSSEARSESRVEKRPEIRRKNTEPPVVHHVRKINIRRSHGYFLFSFLFFFFVILAPCSLLAPTCPAKYR